MKIPHISKEKGNAILEIVLIVAIIIVILLFISQRYRPAGYYYTNGYTTKTTQQQYVNQPSNTGWNTTTQGGVTTYPTNDKPVITLYGDNPYSIFHPGIIPACEPGLTTKCPPRTDIYTEPGYRALDREDGDITSKVKVSDEQSDYAQIPQGPCTTYNKKYTVTDSNGNTTVARRVINECNGN